ncbi:hypothetical protein CEE45_13675 [Candidatus Heimdallarchaeota archaeon B3_Heim]|nr:MAG: hypothetical protein CEE45_13675 [Candidatus Heimdallarchaeota archaeon B3_Heim]
MNQETLEHLYVTGDYSLLLEEIDELRYNHSSTKLSDLEKAICVSYHTRALIRLGKVKDAKETIEKISKPDITKHYTISSLIYQTSIINLHITRGNITEAINKGFTTISIVEQQKLEFSENSKFLSFWSSFLYFLIGMAHYYEFKNNSAAKYFQKSLKVNESNQFIKAKCLYYSAFIEREKGNITKYYELLEESLKIFQTIDAKQGMAWIGTWQGQYSLHKGEFKEAKEKFSEVLALFRSISDIQGLNVVNSLTGLMFYQQGEIEQAEEILREAFDSSVEIGNPMILSYCYLPLVFLYVESKNRPKAHECNQKFQEFSKTTSNEVVKLHGSLAKAIFLKSSSRFIDKGHAQQIFHKLLEDANSERYPKHAQILPTSDKDFSFLVVSHLIELYIEEFKLTEDKKIMVEAQQLLDDHIQMADTLKFSPKLVEFSLLKAKMLIVDGKIEKALAILEQVKKDANINKLHRLQDKVSFEMMQIEREFQKWDAAISVKERIEKVQIEDYLKKAQKLISEHQQD